MLRARVLRTGTGTVPPGGSLPHAAVLGVRHGHGVLSVGRCRVSGADLVVFEGQAGQTACFRPKLRARGAGGELVIGSAGGPLRVVVLGDGDIGRYAPPGSIVVEPLAFRLGLYLLPRGRRLRAERRAARQRLLKLLTKPA